MREESHQAPHVGCRYASSPRHSVVRFSKTLHSPRNCDFNTEILATLLLLSSTFATVLLSLHLSIPKCISTTCFPYITFSLMSKRNHHTDIRPSENYDDPVMCLIRIGGDIHRQEAYLWVVLSFEFWLPCGSREMGL